jgi:YebC/PmpR family DNA-binding regulatory protein
MSGHSKWATIKHKKGAADARRGKIFTKIIKEMTVAARIGGGDVDANPRLRTAVAAAKAENMPADNIKRAIQKGTGELPGASYEEFTFEGYGPGGVALLVDVATDNRNRTVSELRHIFSKNGGNMGEQGCVAWMFHKKGTIILSKDAADEETLLTLALDAGAEDLRDDGSQWEVVSPPEAFHAVTEKLKGAGLAPASAELSMVAQTSVKLTGKPAAQMVRMMEDLEDHEDVQRVHANFEIEEAELHELAKAG